MRLRSLLALDVAIVSNDPDGPFEVEVFDAELDDVALLHRDPRAERSRLVTRRFVAAAVSRWWSVVEPELLGAQVLLQRFAEPVNASLATADSWSELVAGGAEFVMVMGHRLAIVVESDRHDPVVHAATFVSVDAVTVGIVTSASTAAVARHRCERLLAAHLTSVPISSAPGDRGRRA